MASPRRPGGVRTSRVQDPAPNNSYASYDEVQALRAEVEELRQLLWTQQRALEGTTPTSAEGARGFLKTGDRRAEGLFDTRFHSASSGATPPDYRMLPLRIVLIRHAESEGNVDNMAYTYLPDNKVPLTRQGWDQALRAGERLRELCRDDETPSRLFFYTSPYLRSKQTYEGVAEAFPEDAVLGCQEEVQLREQDFGNFQDLEGKQREKAERLRFGRFFYRFPNGESGADVYDRMTIFEDHLVRDINAGRFGTDCTLVLVTHGLALRVFLMRWFHWTVDEFLRVFNPPNAEPLVLERIVHGAEARPAGAASWMHTKMLYRLTLESRAIVKGCSDGMCGVTLESNTSMPTALDRAFAELNT